MQSAVEHSRMEAKYSVGVTNRYALFLGEEDDPGDNILPSSNRPEKPESKDSKKKEKVVKVKSKEVKERGQQKVTVDGGNIKREWLGYSGGRFVRVWFGGWLQASCLGWLRSRPEAG